MPINLYFLLLLTDFSLSQWLSEKSISDGQVLSSSLSDELLESLSLGPYLLLDTECKDYTSLSDDLGWSSGNV